MRKKSELFTHKIKINEQVVVLYEVLMSLKWRINFPNEVSEEVQKMIQFLEDKYFPLPETTKDIEIIDKEYELCTHYVEILD